jgi:preprotein translocase subunit YajC
VAGQRSTHGDDPPGTCCKAAGQHYSHGAFQAGQAPDGCARAGFVLLLPSIRKGTETMFISPAYAQTGGASDPFTGLLIPMLVMILIFYFLVIRPQQQRSKAHRELVDKVRRGDTVITSGGFIGKVMKASDNSDEIEVELSETMRVRVLKSTLMDVRAKGEPVKE